ncbi:MAG: sigma 54-interacting transcriptional regulator [Proteobacteria bacterium]|nr:sigma 54-interacting transcriptional regulator [Pseudomonadota bacterium]
MKTRWIQRTDLIETMEKIFDPIPIPIILVDGNMKVQLVNKAFAQFLDYKKENMIGKSAVALDKNTRWPHVFKSRQAEIAWKHTFVNGKTAVVHRIPVLDEENRVAYGFGMVLFETVENMKEIIQKNKLLESQLKHYEKVLSQINTTRYTWDHICGQSLSIRQTVRMGKKASQTVSNVLLTGESGTGKELFAHAIHHGSQRKSSPFIKINCAAIPAQLIESELFGYEEGAFTGARRGGKKGKFELADKGSIFLDEIGDLPLDMQAKLLRVLQEKEFERIGGNRTIQVDVRVIAATNKNLKQMCREGLFRSDLFFRLNVMSIQIPSLKERMDDLPVLIEVLLDKLAQKLDKKRIPISQDALAGLGGYHWPGNIRELENMLERAMILADRDIITREHLALPQVISDQPLVPSACSLKTIVETVEKNAIAACLKQVGGNRSEAARILEISRSALYDRLKKFNL